MTRDIFIKRAFQTGLLALLALVGIRLRNRVTTLPGCSVCPEQGSCPGKDKCTR